MSDFELSEIQAARNRRRRRRYRINLSRYVYNEQEFTESFIKRDEYVSSSEFEPSSLAKTFKRHFFPTRCTCKDVLQSWFPIVEWLPAYDVRRDLAHDVAGGLTVAIMHIPQGKKEIDGHYLILVVPLRLKRSTVRRFTVPFRILSQKHMTTDNVLFKN